MDFLGRHVWKVPFMLMLVVTVKGTANNTTLLEDVEAGGFVPIHGSAKANNTTQNLQNAELGDFAPFYGLERLLGFVLPRKMHHGLGHCPPCPSCDEGRLPLCPPPPSQPEVGPAPPPPEVTTPPPACPPTANATVNTTTTAAEAKHDGMKQSVTAGLKVAGYGITMLPYVLPFVIAWRTGNLQHTSEFYSEWNLGCTALTSYGWLMYSVVQVSYKDQQELIGIEAIVVNAISFAVSGFMLVILLFTGRQGKGQVCVCVVLVHTAMVLGIVQFPILRQVVKDSSAKKIIGSIAGLFQGLSVLLPMIKLMAIWRKAAPEGGYQQIRHFKKFVIIRAGIDSVISVYWMLYCVFTYQFDEFGISGIACAVLSLMSFVAHCAGH